MRGGVVAVLLFCSIIAVSPAVHGFGQGPQEVEKWFQKHRHKKEKTTKLHFFFHDTVSGKNPTALMVAEAETTAKSPTVFGALYVMDDPLTVGPEPNSTLVGRAQGIYASADQEERGLLMTLNLAFTSGKFKGSSLSVLGRNSGLNNYREMPIIGGSGVFRLARGTVTAQTRSFNVTTGDAVVEWHVIAIHY
ncbi:hypothetical protein NMG60_11019461 [Bertholletia excelsa]